MTKSINIAVILAGGIGKRVGGDIPKQLRTLSDGRTMLQMCIDTFQQSEDIDRIVVVMHPDWTDHVPEGIEVIDGGKERWESSWHAVQALAQQYPCTQEVNVLLHDCARPFVSQAIIHRVCEALTYHQAVSVAVPVTDTIYSLQQEGIVHAIPPREQLMRAQTPQAFRLSVIRQAFEKALENTQGICATDDAGIVHTYSPTIPIYVVEGEEQNKKITYLSDLE